MPLELSLHHNGNKRPYLRHVVFPGFSGFIEDLSEIESLHLGFMCTPGDEGFEVFSLPTEQLQATEGNLHSCTDESEVTRLYQGGKDETYRYPFINSAAKEATVVARHIGGLATVYGPRNDTPVPPGTSFMI